MPLEKLWMLQSTLEPHWRDYNSPRTQAHMVKQSSIHASLKWEDDGTASSKWTGFCKISFCLEFTARQYMPVLLFKRVSTSTSLCACIVFEHRYIFVYLGLQYKWDHLSSNNFGHASCIHKGLHAGKWPDLMTSKPDALNTLRYPWIGLEILANFKCSEQWVTVFLKWRESFLNSAIHTSLQNLFQIIICVCYNTEPIMIKWYIKFGLMARAL